MTPSSHPNGSKRKFYPFSLVLLSLWVVFIAVMIWWLERVVRRVPEEVKIDPHVSYGASPRSWIQAIIVRLPGTLLTVFAQAHGPITAMHLARIAVSALSRRSSAPNTWVELFWLADREWSGPIGIAKTTWMTKWWTRTAPAPSASEDSRTAPPPMTTSAPEDSRVSRASLTFILFATTSAVALITPVLLSQAYRLENIFFPHSITGWVPDAVSFDKMRHVDGSDQMNMGINSWVYDNRAALSMDSNLLYKPVDVGAIARELFRTGDIGNGTVLDLDGLHLNVSCARISSPSLATGNLNTSWTTFCQSQISQFHGLPLVGRKGGKNSTDESGVPLLTEFSLYLCNNQTNAFPFLEGAQSQNTGYAYYTYTQVSKDRESATGLVQCNSTLTTGTVNAYGSNRTYTNFTPRWFLNSSNATQPILDPLFAVFGSLEKAEVDPVDTIFGTAYRGNRSEHPDFSDYISRRVAFSLTDAIITFTSALARLSRDTVLHEGHIPVPIGVYTRHNAFAVCAYVLLVLWVVLIAALSLWSYRRTFSEKLDSYVAAELAFQEGFDLEGSLPGGENEGCLNRPFAFPERGQGGRRQQVLQDGSTGGGKDRLSQG